MQPNNSPSATFSGQVSLSVLDRHPYTQVPILIGRPELFPYFEALIMDPANGLNLRCLLFMVSTLRPNTQRCASCYHISTTINSGSFPLISLNTRTKRG